MNLNSSVESMIKGLINFSPWLLVIGMLLLFCIPAGLQQSYYSDIFTPRMGSTGIALSVMIAIALIIVRMATGFASAKLFVSGSPWSGLITLTLSVGLTYFEHLEAPGIANHYADGDLLVEGTMTGLIRAAVWAACGLELILAMVLYQSKEKMNDADNGSSYENDMEELKSMVDSLNAQMMAKNFHANGVS
ncbi:MAG: hypothetical protein AAF731_07790 [Bacteroidota bacterium]